MMLEKNGYLIWQGNPTLGYKVFEPAAKTSNTAEPKRQPGTSPSVSDGNQFVLLHLSGRKAKAEGYLNADGSIIVRKGSSFSLTETKSCENYLRKRRAELIRLKQVVNGEFVEDVTFTSLSTAAGCILGASVNGKELWLYPDGKSFKEKNSRKID